MTDYTLSGYGLEILERIPLRTGDNPHNRGYLAAKRDRLGHWMDG